MDSKSVEVDKDYLIRKFGDLTSLSAISLRQNQITTISLASFSDLSNLTDLDLSGNKLTRLDLSLFQSLTNLTRLDLSRNQLVQLDENLFAKISKLAELFLHENKLDRLNRKCFSQIMNKTQNIEWISLYANTRKFKSYAKGVNTVFMKHKNELVENECVFNFNEFLFENECKIYIKCVIFYSRDMNFLKNVHRPKFDQFN